MKKIIVIITLLLATSATAAEPARISVVDMQKLLESSTAASAIKEKAKKERDTYQASIAKEEESLRKEESKLAEERSILTQDAFNEKRRKFNDKLTKIQRDFQEKRSAHEANLKQSLDKVNKVIFEIIDSLAEEENFDLTIPTSQILYATKKLDITAKVLERLNQKLPTIDSIDDSQRSKTEPSAGKEKKNKNSKKQNKH